MTIEPYDWRSDGACKGMATDLFFPDRGAPTLQAKQVCSECPVIVDCAEAGMREYHGVWAGLSEKQRRRMRRLERAS